MFLSVLSLLVAATLLSFTGTCVVDALDRSVGLREKGPR